MNAPEWMTPEQAAAYVKGTSEADEAWANRPVRRPEDAPEWYTDRQKQEWAQQ